MKQSSITIYTPENMALNVDLVSVADRIATLISDLVRLIVIVILLLIPSSFLSSLGTEYAVLSSIWVNFVLFFVWHGYFIYYELKFGATPAKRKMGYRIINIDGGNLSGSAIYIRNIMREIEIWMPLRLLIVLTIVPETLVSIPQIIPWLWMILLLMVPYIDKYNRRLGDILAGTVIIKTKKQVRLEKDLVEIHKKEKKETGESYHFTFEMLDFYGKKELQTLEEIFRRADTLHKKSGDDLFYTVSEKIVKKIGYHERVPKSKAKTFLKDFYAAQRKHLEGKLMHGRSVKRKGHETKKYQNKSGNQNG